MAIANDLIKYEGRKTSRLNVPDMAFNLSDEQAASLLAITGNDLGACIDFCAAQEAAMAAEGPFQNIPPDEQG